MKRHYSTLELVKFDETIRAPDRDYDATAFELDADALAPQVNKPYYVTRCYWKACFLHGQKLCKKR